MSRSTESNLLSIVRRWVGPTADATSDATLLARYVETQSEDAFAKLVDRHGPLVWGLCRRELGETTNADDALQATFCVLARDARKVRGESLAGWLCKVAVRVSRRQAGRQYRHAMEPLGVNDAMKAPPPEETAQAREVVRFVHDALAELPDKYRAVLVHCDLEGRTNTETAKLLECPVGTVDSRLHTARGKLKDKLTRKGLAPAVATAALAGLAPTTIATSLHISELFDSTIRNALAYATKTGTTNDSITTLADGVTTTMTTLKLTIVGGMAAVFLGTAGAGLYYAQAQTPGQAKPTTPAQKTNPEVTTQAPQPQTPTIAVITTAMTTSFLQRDAGFKESIHMSLMELFQQLSEAHGVTFRADEAFFKAKGIAAIYDEKIQIQITKRLSVKDILDEVAARFEFNGEGLSLSHEVGYRVKGNQVILGQGYTPPAVPGSHKTGEPTLNRTMIEIGKAIYGPTVSISVKAKSIEDVVDILREQSGSNIVLDKRANNKGEPMVGKELTLVLNDTKLLTALKVVGNMDGYAVAVVDNVYYLTDPINAAKLQKEADTNLFGDPARMGNPVPPGMVTDGAHYYEKPGILKPIETGGVGSGKLPPPPEKP